MCFGSDWIESIILWLIGIAILVGLVKIVLPWVLSQLGVAGGMVIQAINVVVIGLVCIAIVIIGFDVFRCAHFVR
jgi:hypothetical protein